MHVQIIAVLCVIAVSIGQMLFKFSATSLAETGSLFTLKTAASLFAAMTLYAITSLVWVWVLQKAELGQIYPLMALAFILVPLGSYFIFGERFHTQYFVGVALIIAGIIITMKT